MKIEKAKVSNGIVKVGSFLNRGYENERILDMWSFTDRDGECCTFADTTNEYGVRIDLSIIAREF